MREKEKLIKNKILLINMNHIPKNRFFLQIGEILKQKKIVGEFLLYIHACIYILQTINITSPNNINKQ